MISQGGSGGGVDLAEVARDAELLDQLATRTAILDDDAVGAMLAAFAAEVDDGLVAMLDDVEPGDRRPADRALVAVPDVPAVPRRGHGLRATTIAVVLGATLSVSGVAAAVTGDPLSPYKGIVSAVQGGNHHELPANAAQVAKMNHKLVGTRAQIAHGDLAGAQATLAGLRLELASMTDLTTRERNAIEARIAALEAALGRATGQVLEKQQNSGTKRLHTAVPQNSRAQQPSSTRMSEPNATKTPEPDATKSPEPDNTKTPEPANTGTPAGGTHTAEPQNTRTVEPTDSAVGGGGGGAQAATDPASKGGGTAQGMRATH